MARNQPADPCVSMKHLHKLSAIQGQLSDAFLWRVLFSARARRIRARRALMRFRLYASRHESRDLALGGSTQHPSPVFAHHHFAASYILLPFEILAQIFNLLNSVDRLCASHVCSHWRTASIVFAARLSSEINWRGRRSAVFAALVNRTASSPIRVRVGLRHPQYLSNIEFAGVIQTLHSNMQRIASLRISFCGPSSDIRLAILLYALRRPAPILKVFSFTQIRAVDYIQLPVDLFGGEAPQLRHVTFNGGLELGHGQNLNILRGVTRLGLSTQPLCPELLATIGLQCPALEYLFLVAGTATNTESLPASFPVQLSRLAVEVYFGHGPELLRYFSCWAIKQLRIAHYPYIFVDLFTYRYDTWKTMTISMSVTPGLYVALQMEGLNGHSVVVTRTPIWQDLSAAPFGRITNLVIYESSLARGCLRLPVMLSVRSLTLILKPPINCNLVSTSFFDLREPPAVVLECPRLLVITLLNPLPESTVTLDEIEFLRFITHGVRFAACKLRTLDLVGVVLIGDEDGADKLAARVTEWPSERRLRKQPSRPELPKLQDST